MDCGLLLYVFAHWEYRRKDQRHKPARILGYATNLQLLASTVSKSSAHSVIGLLEDAPLLTWNRPRSRFYHRSKCRLLNGAASMGAPRRPAY